MDPLTDGRYWFGWREGNRFRLLTDGPEFFPHMLGAIERAEQYVLLEMYLVSSGKVTDRFIEALTLARSRGVAVHLLLDDFGAAYLSRRDRRRLTDAGVEVAWYNPVRYRKWRRNLLRDHRKLLLVDGKVAYIGGVGITDEFAPLEAPGLAWHEAVVEVRGPCVVDWFELFVRNLMRWTERPPKLPYPDPEPFADGSPGRVVVNSPTRTEIKRSLLKRLRTARRRIWIATAYFIPSRKFRRALRRAADAGVDVRLLLPGPYTDHPPVRHAGRRFYGRLLRHGVRIFEYQPRFLHAKVFLCDDWVAVGSSNGDRWNLRWNLEANQEIADPDFTVATEQMFLSDFSSSREYTAGSWFARPWHRRLLERFWGWVDRLMDRHAESRWRRFRE